MRKAWPFMANFWGFGALALFVPLLVVHYGDLGFSGVQIGLLTGLPPIVSAFGAPLWTNLADRTGRHRRILGVVFAGAVVAVVLIAMTDTFFAVLLLLLLFYLALSPFASFVDTATMHMLGDEKDRYGRIRVGATFGFAIFAWVGGVIAERVGIVTSFYAAAAVFVVGWFFARQLDFGEPEVTSDGDATGFGDMVREPRWVVFMAMGIAGGIGFALAAGFFYPYMEEVGAAESTIGLAIFIGTISEVPVLFWGNRFLAAMRPFTLLVATIVFTGVRFVLLAFAPTVGVVMAIQATHGLTFVLMWVAAVAYADKHAPVGRKTTAQGLFAASTTGIGAAIGGLAAGPILAGMGADSLYLIGGVAIVVVAVVAGAVGIRLDRRSAAA